MNKKKAMCSLFAWELLKIESEKFTIGFHSSNFVFLLITEQILLQIYF